MLPPALRRILSAAAVTAILLAPAALRAQPGIRTLTGIVTDRQHEPLAGAVVQLHDENTDFVTTYITTRTGRYSFKRLSTDDDYSVFATFRDVRSRTRQLSKFDSKAVRTIPLVVKLP